MIFGDNHTWQLFEAILLLVVALLGVVVPHYIGKYPSRAPFLAFGNAFSGGVLLSTGLVHMLSTAVELFVMLGNQGEFGKLLSTSHNATMLANIGCVVGVLVPFMLEKGGLLFFLMQHEGILARIFNPHSTPHHTHDHTHNRLPLTSPNKANGVVKPSTGDSINIVSMEIPGVINPQHLDKSNQHQSGQAHTNRPHDFRRRTISAEILVQKAHPSYGSTNTSTSKNRPSKNETIISNEADQPLLGAAGNPSESCTAPGVATDAKHNYLVPKRAKENESDDEVEHLLSRFGAPQHVPENIPGRIVTHGPSAQETSQRSSQRKQRDTSHSPSPPTTHHHPAYGCASACNGENDEDEPVLLARCSSDDGVLGRTNAAAVVPYEGQWGRQFPQSKSMVCLVPSVASVLLQNRIDLLRGSGFARVVEHADMMYPDDLDDGRAICEGGHDHDEVHKHSHVAFARVMLSVVLSIHSIFAGITLGLASPGSSYSFDAFIALLLHKLFEAIALGVTVSRDVITRGVVANVLVYALCAPAGILLGALLASNSNNHNRLFYEALIVSITSGSFLYIALVEIVSEEFEDEEHRVVKFICFFVGAFVMAGLGFWV